jgi:hypothetical protein
VNQSQVFSRDRIEVGIENRIAVKSICCGKIVCCVWYPMVVCISMELSKQIITNNNNLIRFNQSHTDVHTLLNI